MVESNRFDALVYRDGKRRSGIVRRQYELWRSEQSPPIPLRCDNPQCHFHAAPLEWNGKTLKLILDHENGNNTDNRPKNLRLLCPNCDSQLTDTKGGANRGRIEKSSGGFALVSKTGSRSYVLPVEAGQFVLQGQEVDLQVGTRKGRTSRSTRSRAKTRAPG
jgi:hypothetical protein